MRIALVTSMLAIAIASCGPKMNANQNTSLINSGIISDRPTNTEQEVVLIRLESPALFATATKDENGKVVISDESRGQVMKEQEELKKTLEGISKDIRVLYTYKFVLNALAVVVPQKHVAAVKELRGGGQFSVVKENHFSRPQFNESTVKNIEKGFTLTSVDHIGASKVHSELKITGKGTKVGILDTGIDYTHAMLGGDGNPETYNNTDPDKETNLFPNKKVVGGIDLVGTNYDAGAGFPDHQIPRPDLNPLDEGGHGTHVAGTVAGIGDEENVYAGVAPDAELYAIKVFGANGSTGDSVVIAGLEYSADPNGDGNPDDMLDVVNLSLGGDYGKAHIMYSEAVKNTVKAGIVFVAAAGNAGHTSYIVGSPSTSEDAISVAASVDGMDHNWKFDTTAFALPNRSEPLLAERIEGSISKPISEVGDLSGKLVHVGIADQDLSDEVKAKLKGNVALVDRGVVTFFSKLQTVKAGGAIGMILANNKPGDAFAMGGDGKEDIPAIMITKDLGDEIKEAMKSGDVVVKFASDKKVEKPQLIDTLTDFSSRGPRSNDALIKPEIAAPGFNIISAAMGEGTKGVAFNGTSMATPHMAGVMALMKQKFPKLPVLDLKALVMNTAKSISDADDTTYPVSMQGAGRVQTFKAITAKALVQPSSISLGETNLVTAKTFVRSLTVKNLTGKAVTYKVKVQESEDFEVSTPAKVSLASDESKSFEFQFKIKRGNTKDATKEFEAVILLLDEEDNEVARVPVLAIGRLLSKITAGDLAVHATDLDDAEGALVKLTLKNEGKNPGEALLFNLLGKDPKKPSHVELNQVYSRSCDLQAAGYRIVGSGEEKMLQVAVKLHNPVSRWQGCEISAQIDTDGDQVAEQELVGIYYENLRGLDGALQPGYYSLLLDAVKVRKLRLAYEKKQQETQGKDGEKPNYTPAVVDVQEMVTYNHTTVAVIQAPLQAIGVKDDGQIHIKLGVLNEDQDSIQADDFLGVEDKWLAINPKKSENAFFGMPESVTVKPGETEVVTFTKGAGTEKLLLLMPHNKPVKLDSGRKDSQSEILKEIFQF